MMKSSAWVVGAVVLGALGAATPSWAQEPCGGVRLAGGQVQTGQPLVPGAADSEVCLRYVGEQLRMRSDIRSITVAARVPDEARVDGKALAQAQAAAEVLVAAGVPRTRVFAVAPPANAGEGAQLRIAYVERSARRPVARLRTGTEVRAGPDEASIEPRAPGDVLYAQDEVRTADAWAEVELADGSLLRLAPQSALRLGVVALDAQGQRQVQVEVLRGTVDAQASQGPQGAVFEVRTRTAVAGVRGTRFRTSVVDAETSRLETLEGRVALSAGQGEVEVGGGFGSRVKGGQPPEAPRPLLAAPEVESPRSGRYTAAPRLAWKPVPGAAGYQVELARDPDFATQLRRSSAQQASLALEALPEGKWFWRVQAMDADGFVGFTSKIYAFDVRP